MDVSELLGLSYPETDDPQAIALYMEDLAFKLENLLTSVDNETDAFNARPCAYWTNLVGAAPVSGSVLTIDWNLSAPLAYQGSVDQTPAIASGNPLLPERRSGLWYVGFSLPIFTATTPNANTYRMMTIRCNGLDERFQALPFAGPRNNPNVTTDPNWIYDQTWETNTGAPGACMTANALAWVPPNAQVSPATLAIGSLETFVASFNTSSTVPLAAGTAFCWAVWMGYGTQQIVQV